MLEELIDELGVMNVARACEAHHQAVCYWKACGLPSRRGDAKRRAHYERCIAKLAGMKVGDLRRMLAEEEAAKAA